MMDEGPKNENAWSKIVFVWGTDDRRTTTSINQISKQPQPTNIEHPAIPQHSKDQQHTMGKKNGKRPFGETTRNEYASACFEQLKSNDSPRSPHSFFETSHIVSFSDTPSDSPSRKYEIKQVVHKHRNDICIVTAGEHIPSSVTSIKFLAQEAPACSAGAKRKRQAKMLKGKNVEHTVSPSTLLAELTLESGEVVPLYACVFGTIIEVNQNLTPEILADDPLLNGFLAIILPSGSFPPRPSVFATNNDQEKTPEAPSAAASITEE
jgi:glycine cleavage system H lipoate-binding protein